MNADMNKTMNDFMSCDAADPRVRDIKHFFDGVPTRRTSHLPKDCYTLRLSNNQFVTCVYWNGRFLMSGNDIAKIVSFRLWCRGITFPSVRKLEEGVVSDLRPFKPGQACLLEEGRSELLWYLREIGSVKTLKRQKIFVLEKIPHDGLFKNAVERELLRASRNAFVAVSEPSVTLLDAPRTTEMVVVNSHALDEPMSDMPLFCN